MGDPDGIPGSWLQPGMAVAVVPFENELGRINQLTSQSLPFLSLCVSVQVCYLALRHSAFQISHAIP